MKYIIKADKSGCPFVIIEPQGETKQGKKMGSLLYPNFKIWVAKGHLGVIML